MTTEKSANPQYVEVKETVAGINQVNDLVNLFGYDVKIPCETIGALRTMKKEEIKDLYPNYKVFTDNLKEFSKYLKSVGSDVTPRSYSYRATNIRGIEEILKITSTLQFVPYYNDIIDMYLDNNVGWGLIRVEPIYDENKLTEVKVYLGDKLLDLSKPVPIQMVNWKGELIDYFDLVDFNNYQDHKETKAINIGLRINDASIGDDKLFHEAARRFGQINVRDMRTTFVGSILEGMLFRLYDPNDGLYIDTNESPIFTELDFAHNIQVHEVYSVLNIVSLLRERDEFHNSVELFSLNLLRWGILDNSLWQRGYSYLSQVLNEMKQENKEGSSDWKITEWAFRYVRDAKAKDKTSQISVDNIISACNISKLASMSGKGIVIVDSLLFDGRDDNGRLQFKEATIAFRSKRERVKRFQSITRLNTDIYEIGIIDKDLNVIGEVSPIDVAAIVNYDVRNIIINIEGSEETKDPTHLKLWEDLKGIKM